MSAFRKAKRVLLVQIAAMLVCFGCLAAVLLYEAIWPETGDVAVYHENEFVVDASNAQDGYFLARRGECSSSLKMRVTHGEGMYTYDLNRGGAYEVFPLQMGDGNYVCTLYRHVEGNKYSKEAEIQFNVEMEDENLAYLSPSQYVYYTQEYEAVKKADELCRDLETDEEKYQAIVNYIADNFSYDYERAATIREFYLGDAKVCYETRIGLCQDLSVVAACMLRTQGIPAQLVIGYADNYYHAWNNVLIDGEYRRLDITAEVTGVPASVYTEERHY